LVLGLFLTVSGCRLAQDVVAIPGEVVGVVTPGTAKAVAVDVVALQQKLLRVTDGFQTGAVDAIDRLRNKDGVLDHKTSLTLKISLMTGTTSIVSGSDTRANVLDMTVLVALTRMSVEDYWLPKVFGDSGKALLDVFRGSEAELWILSGTLLTTQQQQELLQGMVAWKLEHAAQESVVAARSVGFAAEVASGGKDGAGRSGGLLSVLSLDPMAGLDPAVREITQARQLAERALFVAQRMPKLIRWQTEMYTIEALDLPATRQMVANTTQITASIEKVTAVVEKLPEKLTKEREELVKILENQEKTLKPLVTEVRQTVEAGNELSKSLTVTLKTLDEFIARVSPPGPKDPNAEPFRIQDYVKAAAQAEATIRQATELIASLDKTLASDPVKKISEQVAPVVKQGEAAARDLVDHVFHQALILVGVILAAALAYRFVASRWVGPRQAK
jgi:hypothetical protein